MLPRNRLRQVTTTAVLVVAALSLTAAAAPGAAPLPLPPAGPIGTSAGATFDRAGGAALVGGLAMVAFLLVAGVAALVVSVRMLLATIPPGSTSRGHDRGREQSAVELGESGGGPRRRAAGSPTIPAPRRPLSSGTWSTPTR
ncbi:hypothetical protein [Pseudonocardia sp.]|uniref:hypothetical protein n=1 Tax=Pseudonocardia sp. TaxID=60912 RepID=UPI003D114868